MRWENDGLKRGPFAQVFARLLKSRFKAKNGKSFIVNLDAQWGEGKTYFLKNLAEDLRVDGHPVAYVNAWEDDRSDDPLIAVIHAIDAALKPHLGKDVELNRKFKHSISTIAPIAKEAGRQVGLHATKLLLGLSVEKLLEAADEAKLISGYEPDADAISSAVDKSADATGQKYLDSRVNLYEEGILAISSFRAKVGKFIKETKNFHLPLFVLVDELDRCRPLYAVRLLEELKHIFDIDGIVFVIGTDSEQLSYSINALYGEKFDSQTYLRRFFDRVVVFPPVQRDALVVHLCKVFSLDLEDVFYHTGGQPPITAFVTLANLGLMTNRDLFQFFEILSTFVSSWNLEIQIEPFLLAALTKQFLDDPRKFATASLTPTEFAGWKVLFRPRNEVIKVHQYLSIVERDSAKSLRDLSFDNNAASDYYRYEAEMCRKLGGNYSDTLPSSLNSYRERIVLAGRSVAKEEV